MFRRGLLCENSESKYLYEISKKGAQFVSDLYKSFNDELQAEDLQPSLEKLAIPIPENKEMTADEFAEKYVALFPKSHYCHPKVALVRFGRFHKEFPEYNLNLILEAVAKYIKEFSNSESGTTDMKTAKYLIWKLENKEITYDLATVCQKYIEQNDNKKMEFNLDFLNTA